MELAAAGLEGAGFAAAEFAGTEAAGHVAGMDPAREAVAEVGFAGEEVAVAIVVEA
jgi:hypothetical protein